MNFRRGIIAGFCWGLVGLVSVAAGIAAFTFESGHDLRSNFAWWQLHAFPGIVVIPLLLFFTGIVTYTPTRRVGFAKNLAILAVTTLSLAILLGLLGMAHPRCKGGDHPPMYLSEVLMFLMPLTAVSFLLIYTRSGPSVKRESFLGDSLPSTVAATEPAHDRPGGACRSTRRKCDVDELRSILASVGDMYHVTTADRWEQVQARGLDPAEAYRINGGLYSISVFANRGFNCFVTRFRLPRVFRMFDDGLGNRVGDRVILRVPARVIAERTFDLDRTQTTIGLALRGIEVPPPELFQSLLDEVGYVVCFDTVPPESIEFVATVAQFLEEPDAAADGGT